MKCKAHSSRTGKPCQREAMRGREVCYTHGGAVPVGPDHPRYKHGKYSRYALALPEGWRDQLEELLRDRNFMSLKERLAVLDQRLLELLKRVNTGEAGMLWLQAKESLQLMLDISRDETLEPTEKARRYMQAMEVHRRLIEQGVADHYLWREIGEIIEQQRKILETESRRILSMRKMIAIDEVIELMKVLMDRVRVVTPPKQFAWLQRQLEQMVYKASED